MVSGDPAQHVHKRRNNGKGRSALASAHGRNGKRRVETRNAGRAGAHRPSEALHPTRSSEVLPRIARERVPTAPHVAKTRRNVPRRSASLPVARCFAPFGLVPLFGLGPVPRWHSPRWHIKNSRIRELENTAMRKAALARRFLLSSRVLSS